MQLNNLDLNRLNVFGTIYERGGVGAAARSLGLTPSAVSQSLAQLERALALKLFDRLARRLHPTPAAAELYEAWRTSRAVLSKKLNELQLDSESVRGTIRLGVYHGFYYPELIDRAAAFLSDHQRATLRINFISSAEIFQRLHEGSLDCALSYQSPPPQFSALSTPICEQELVLVGQPALVREIQSSDDLKRIPIVDYYERDLLAVRWANHHFGDAPRLTVRAYGASAAMVLRLVQQGVGAGVVPRHIAQSAIVDRSVAVVSPQRKELSEQIWLVERFLDPLDGLRRAFREVLSVTGTRKQEPVTGLVANSGELY